MLAYFLCFLPVVIIYKKNCKFLVANNDLVAFLQLSICYVASEEEVNDKEGFEM